MTSTETSTTPLEAIDDKIGRARGLVRLITAALPIDRDHSCAQLFDSINYGLMAVEDLLDDMESQLPKAAA